MKISRALSLYVVAFFSLLATAFYLPISKLDYYAYEALYIESEDEVQLLSDKLLLIDLPGPVNNTDSALSDFRQRLADLLRTISAGEVRPKAVVLDYFFSNNEDGIESVIQAIESVSSMGGSKYEPVKVYRVLDVLEAGRSLDDVLDGHYRPLYEDPSLYAHSIYNLNSSILSYETVINVPAK